MYAASSVFSIHRPKIDLLLSKTNEKEVHILLVSAIEVDKPLLILCAKDLVILLMDTIVLPVSANENILKEGSSSERTSTLSLIKRAY